MEIHYFTNLLTSLRTEISNLYPSPNPYAVPTRESTGQHAWVSAAYVANAQLNLRAVIGRYLREDDILYVHVMVNEQSHFIG